MEKSKQQAKSLICPILEIVALLFLAPMLSFGQASALGSASVYTGVAQKSTGTPASNATVRVCTGVATGNPCSPMATIYQDFSLLTPKTNPLTTDSIGNFNFFANPDKYLIQISGTGINTYSYYAVPGITSFGYWVTPGSGLNVNITQGRVWCNGSIQTYSGGTLALTANATNYIYLSTVSPCAPATDTVGFSNVKIPLQTVVTGNTSITTSTDQRTYFGTQLVPAGAPVFNVQAYGAQGIGTGHDDTIPIQNAINDAQLVGGIVYFPCTGTASTAYFVTSPLVVTGQVHLQGCNGNDILLGAYLQNGGTEDIIRFNSGSRGSEIDNLGFEVPGAATAGAAIHIDIGGTIDPGGLAPLVINNVSIDGTWDGIRIDSGNNFYLHQLIVNRCHNDGLIIMGGTGFYVSQAIFLGSLRANVELRQGGGFFFTDVNTFSGGYGLLVDPTLDSFSNPQGVIQLFFKGFVADSIPVGDGISFPNSGGYVRQVEFVDSWTNTGTGSPPYTGGYGVNLSNPLLDGFRWIGGYLRTCFLSGMNIAGGKNIYVRGATFSANGHNNPSGNIPGIKVAANQGNFHIEYSIFGATDNDDSNVGNQSPGILIPSGTSSGWSFVGNIISGGPVAFPLIQDSSTGAKFLDLRGGAGSNQSVASGTLAVGGSTTVNLAAFVSAPPVSQKQGAHAILRVINGSLGSVSMGSIDLSITHDGCNAAFASNIPSVGSGFQSVSGCTLTLNNASGTVSSPWGVWLVEVDTIGF